jgi:hydroxyacylglutathione hydrolase
MAEMTTAARRAPSRPSKVATAKVARAYFEAIDARDVARAVSMWAPGGREHVRGQADVLAPDGVREFLSALIEALPDGRTEILATTTESDRCAVHWRMTGTFSGPRPFNGIEPTGSAVVLEGCDLLTVRAGLIEANDAFTDSMTFARQVGLMPVRGSSAEVRLASAFNVATRLRRALAHASVEPVAEGVVRVQGWPGRCNVYLISDGTGVTLFDAGARTMVRAVASAAAPLGGVTRIVLGHAHADHRGVAPSFKVPVHCHPDELSVAQGEGGFRGGHKGAPGLSAAQRQLHRMLARKLWDAGPVKISDTVSEGDEVAGFRVVFVPGHSPGMIALWRESDRLALVSDAFLTVDGWGRDTPPALPMHAYNHSSAQARESLHKLAQLAPAAAWPGHGRPLREHVGAQLERLAAS